MRDIFHALDKESERDHALRLDEAMAMFVFGFLAGAVVIWALKDAML